jgi:hypothetical protein
MHKIFINEFGRIRSGWRVLLFICASIAAYVLLVTVLRVVYAILFAVAPSLRPSGFASEIIFRTILLACALIAGYLCARLFEGLPWLRFTRGRCRNRYFWQRTHFFI